MKLAKITIQLSSHSFSHKKAGSQSQYPKNKDAS